MSPSLEDIPPTEAQPTEVAGFSSSRLTFTPNPSPPKIPTKKEISSTTLTFPAAHMLHVTWSRQSGWSSPSMQPYGPLSLAPTASILHYATSCFEGMKLYRGRDGKLRLFRPSLNCRRMYASAVRGSLPAPDPAELEVLLKKLCAVDGPKYLPRDAPLTYLYLRPSLIGTEAAIGVRPPDEAAFFAFLSFMPSLNYKPIQLMASEPTAVRAWPGGVGNVKLGANYGPTMHATSRAKEQGFAHVLWLLGEEGRITEAGACNFITVWRTKDGGIEIATPGLEEGVILDGVTRRSVLELARSRLSKDSEFACIRDGDVEPVTVTERQFTMEEVAQAGREGRLIEAFVVGTAYFVAAVSMIRYKEEDVVCPMVVGDMGKYTKLLKGWLEGIMYGDEQHEWGVVIDEEA